MARTMYRRLVRLQSYVEPALADKVDRFCAAKGLSESKLIKSSVATYIEGTSDWALLMRRLNGIEREIKRHRRDDEFHAEAFAVYVRLWFAHMPSIPEDRKAAARMHSESQFKKFVEHVAQHFDRGERFLDMQPAESVEAGTREDVDVGTEEPHTST